MLGVAASAAALIAAPQPAKADTNYATLDADGKVPISELPDRVLTTNGKIPVGKDELIFNVVDYGAKTSNSWSDNLAAFNRAKEAAALVKGVIGVPPTKDGFALDNFIMDKPLVELRGLALASTTFGLGGVMDAACKIIQPSGSSNVLLTMDATGLALSNIRLDGNSRSGTGAGTALFVKAYNEMMIDRVWISNFRGIGLDVASACNTDWRSVFVMNCGDNDGTYSTAPAVRYKTQASNRSINTHTVRQLNIEFSQGTSLEIGFGDDPNPFGYPEFITFDNLHIESTSTGPNGLGNPNITWPLVKVCNARNVVFTNPFLYGGPYALIEHARTTTVGYAPQYSGLLVLGGSLLGRNPPNQGTSYRPANLVRLITGNGFRMIGTKVSATTSDAVLVESTYGDDVHVDPSCVLDRIGGQLLKDNRSTRSPIRHVSYESFVGFSPSSQNIPAGVYPGITSDGSPGVSWSAGTTVFRLALAPASGRGTVELAGSQEVASFGKRGDWSFGGGIATGIVSKNSNYTIDSSPALDDSTIVCTSGGVTITLPTAVSTTTRPMRGRQYTIKSRASTGNVTVATTSSQTIDGNGALVLSPGQARTVQSDGANWIIIGGYG